MGHESSGLTVRDEILLREYQLYLPHELEGDICISPVAVRWAEQAGEYARQADYWQQCYRHLRSYVILGLGLNVVAIGLVLLLVRLGVL